METTLQSVLEQLLIHGRALPHSLLPDEAGLIDDRLDWDCWPSACTTAVPTAVESLVTWSMEDLPSLVPDLEPDAMTLSLDLLTVQI